MKRLTAVALFGAALCACSQEASLQAGAEHAIRGKLKDPGSAEFTNTFIVRSKDVDGAAMVTVCGDVNGRNSFGGYAGATRFLVTHMVHEGGDLSGPISAVIEDPTERGATAGSQGTDKPTTVFEQVYWNLYCVDTAHPPSYTGEV